MKKISLLALLFSFISCKEIISALSEDFEDYSDDYRFDLDRKKYINTKPEKLIYNVGETIEVTYKIPNKIGKFADDSTKKLIKEKLKINNEDFYLNNHIDTITAILRCVYYGTVKIVEGDIKDSRITYTFQPKLDMYVAKVKLTFIKPGIFYWDLDEYNKETNILPQGIYVEDKHNTDVSDVSSDQAHYKNIFYDIDYRSDKNKFGFKVVEK